MDSQGSRVSPTGHNARTLERREGKSVQYLTIIPLFAPPPSKFYSIIYAICEVEPAIQLLGFLLWPGQRPVADGKWVKPRSGRQPPQDLPPIAARDLGCRDLYGLRHFVPSNIRTMSWSYSLGCISFRQPTHPNCHHADIDTKDYTKLIAHAMKSVQEDPPMSALSASNDARSFLELGIKYPFRNRWGGLSVNLNQKMGRRWTGFGAPQDKPGTIAMWITLASFRNDVPLSLGGRP